MPRGVGRWEQGGCRVVLSSPVQQKRLTTLAKALLPSHSYSPPVEEFPHSMGDGKTSPFHSEFHTTGLFLENLPLRVERSAHLEKRFMFGMWLVTPFSNQADTR